MKVDLTYTEREQEMIGWELRAQEALALLQSGKGAGGEFIGWLRLPQNYDREEFRRIKQAAERIRGNSQVLLVIGIGGSYLGARAVIEALSPAYGEKKPEILFAGNQLSVDATRELMDYLSDKTFSINVISKSGTTTEPAVAFRLFRNLLEKRVGKEEARERIYVTTDREKGALKQLAEREGYERFVVPDDVGGRFTVLTAVGLLPIACSGIDIDALMAGAEEGQVSYLSAPFAENPVLRYAAMRNVLREEGKEIEILVSYEPRLHYLQEWWKQLAGESEGKEGKGLFPASVANTTDLHSLGQWIQQGPRIIFETVLFVDNARENLTVPQDSDNLDGLNYLAGVDLQEINRKAMEGTLQAHVEGGVPNLQIRMDRLDAKNLGKLIYFFELAIGVSGYLLEVNPFNQPGVELYKKNMFRLLGKPGFEK